MKHGGTGTLLQMLRECSKLGKFRAKALHFDIGPKSRTHTPNLPLLWCWRGRWSKPSLLLCSQQQGFYIRNPSCFISCWHVKNKTHGSEDDSGASNLFPTPFQKIIPHTHSYAGLEDRDEDGKQNKVPLGEQWARHLLDPPILGILCRLLLNRICSQSKTSGWLGN